MASGAQILAPGANFFYESISAASRVESGDKLTKWTVILAVFEGPKSESAPAPSSKARPGVYQRAEYSGWARIGTGHSGAGARLRLFQGLRSSAEQFGHRGGLNRATQSVRNSLKTSHAPRRWGRFFRNRKPRPASIFLLLS
jgi:hypothetical protein